MKRSKLKYLNPKLSIEARVNDLIKRMTLEEKAGQLFVFCPPDLTATGSGEAFFEKIKEKLANGVGQLAVLLRHIGPAEGVALANKVQKFLVDETRLGIPAIIHDEVLHGCMAKGSASFPQAIAMASTWNPQLVEQIATAIGKETRARGITQVLSPTINIGRDPRCGRTEETYGEDPLLTSRMAVAFIRGVQSQRLLATAKHFVANFVGNGGRDSHEIHFSERILREICLPAFEAAVREGGAWSVMSAYNSRDGTPCTCDKWLLTDLLRGEWKFRGFVVSDYGSTGQIFGLHKAAETLAEAAKKALEAGMDVELPNPDCFAAIPDLIKQGKLSEKTLDESVKRILRAKFWLGLFENPYFDPDRAAEICDCHAHRKLALEAERQGIILLKNEKILPLKKSIKSIAVIGPSANEPRLGGYSGTGIKVVTPLEGIKNLVSKNTEVHFAEGCKIRGESKEGFAEAVEAAKKSDVAILVVGNGSGDPTYRDATEGEGFDRCDLNLPGVQEDLIDAVAGTGTDIVVVLINGTAITMTRWADKAKAILEAWYPGEEGGNAIAEVIFGECNPGGKLPITFPMRTGQLPLYYNYKPSGRNLDYADLRGKQFMFPFGHGLSYTTFDYANLKIKKSKAAGKLRVKITADIKNAGKRAGDEIVQLYVHDAYSSISRPVKELKGFKRISLKPNETKTVEFVLDKKDLSFLDANMKPVLEPGDFEIMVGASSEDIRLTGTLTV